MRRSQIGRRRGGGRALRRPSALLATLLLLSCSDAANEGGTSPVPFDLAAVSDLTTIAELRPPGVNAAQISSYDRTGGNADFGLGPEAAPLLEPFGIPPLLLDNSFLYRDGERYVIFDEAGPGVVTRIWMTGLDGLFLDSLGGDIAFEVDDEPAPRFAALRNDFFSGSTVPRWASGRARS